MKTFLFSLAFCLTTICATAQDHQSQEWFSDVNLAIQKSNETGKPLFLFFTGSDWCGWCIRLQKEVFQTSYFTKWAKENVILVELDFPRKKQLPQEIQQQNQTLQQMFQVQGYPTVHFVKPGINSDGIVNLSPIGQSGYAAGGPESWCANANGMIKK
ncbi:MAG: thioredoxin family protein [Flavobacteriales bacterium]